MSDDDDLDFYPCLVDGAAASIYVNLKFEHAPPAGHDVRYTLAIMMREPGEHGIGTADETAKLDLVEEALMVKAHALGLLYVGRLRTRGLWEITFYGPRGHLEPMRQRAIDRAEGRKVAAIMNPEPGWTYYRELLLPDAERRQWMDDRRMVQILSEQGDRLSVPRRVDHRIHFTDEVSRDAFATAAKAAGFAVEVDALTVRAHRDDVVELDHIHDVVMILVDAATPLGGRYDRWEAGIVS